MSYVIFVSLGIILYGIAAFTRKLSVDQINPYQIQLISCLVHAALIPVFWHLCPNNKNMSSYAIIMATVTTIIGLTGNVIFSFLLRGNVNPAVISALLGLSPVITFGLSYFIFHDTMSIWKALAFFFAILSVILVNF